MQLPSTTAIEQNEREMNIPKSSKTTIFSSVVDFPSSAPAFTSSSHHHHRKYTVLALYREHFMFYTD